MKILLINGSPNEFGCTHTALKEVSKAIEEQGIETEIAWIGNKPIRGCNGCWQCGKTGNCIFNDDVVNSLAEKCKTADGFVFGSPVFYAGANGALHSVMDRLFSFVNFRGKPAAAIASARRAGTTSTLENLTKYFEISGMPIATSTYYNIIHGHTPEEILADEEGLRTMRNLGSNIAWLVKCIAVADENNIARP